MHNVHATPKVDGNSEFNFAEMNAGDSNDSKWIECITKPEVLVKLKCDVHGWMFCYVGVLDHPFFCVTDKDGAYKIPNVPAGNYALTAYHLKTHRDSLGISQDIVVGDSPQVVNFTIVLK